MTNQVEPQMIDGIMKSSELFKFYLISKMYVFIQAKLDQRTSINYWMLLF